MITQPQLVEYLKEVKSGELRELITTLEDELGVTVPPPMFMQPQQEQNKVVEQTEFDVVLTGWVADVPKAKMTTIKAIRQLTGLGLREAKAAVEAAPFAIQEGINREEAEKLVAVLEEAGGTVKIR